MLEPWLASLESATPVAALRGSTWAYPLVNAAHLLGVALLVGAMVPLDLRLLGRWRSLPLAPLWRLLRASAAGGLMLAIAAGALLFSTDASAYAASRLFGLKMAVVAVGIANALVLRLALPASPVEPLPAWLRAGAAVSLAAWLSALVLGRLIGYF